MSEEIRYVPLLKGKRGEYAALRDLEDWRRPFIRPLIDVPLISAFGAPRTVDHHMDLQLRYIRQYWGSPAPLIIDLRMIDSAATMADGSHPLVWLATNARASGHGLIPCTGPDRPPTYREAVREAAQISGTGAAIRIQGPALAVPDLRGLIEAECAALNLPTSAVDVILDFHDIAPHSGAITALSAAGVLSSLRDWREPGLLVFAAGAFPATLAGIPNRVRTPIARAEWQAYELLLPRLGENRRPVFGDYGISHPDLEDFDASLAGGNVPVAARYTISEEWLVWKAGRVRDVGNAAYADVAQWLVNQPEYSGDGYSWGDTYIRACADGRTRTAGSAEVWRRVGTSHHLALVIDAMLGLRPPANPPAP